MAWDWGGAGSGAMSGASAGATFGPWGAAAGGVAGGLLGGLSGSGNDAQKKGQKRAMGYLNQIPDTIKPYYDPYVNAGKSALPGYQKQMQELMNNPSEFINKMGASYQESPGYQWNKKEAEGGIGNAAAAGGMAGSPQHEQQNAEMVSGLASKDYNEYMNRIMQGLGIGSTGTQGLINTGASMSSDLATNLANVLGSKAGLSYSGGMNQGQSQGGQTGSMMGSLGSLFQNYMNNRGGGTQYGTLGNGRGISQDASGAITRY
jgi:hypothetical protein